MEQTETRASVGVPVSALVLAGCCAGLFGLSDAVVFGSDATVNEFMIAEDVFTIFGLLGWVLLAWAAILGGGYAVLLGSRAASGQRVFGSQVAVVAVALALIVLVLAAHPLWGTGSSVG